MTIGFPIIADADRSIAIKYGMLDPANKDAEGLPLTIRAVFIIGPDKKLKLSLNYPASVGATNCFGFCVFHSILFLILKPSLCRYMPAFYPMIFCTPTSPLEKPPTLSSNVKQILQAAIWTRSCGASMRCSSPPSPLLPRLPTGPITTSPSARR